MRLGHVNRFQNAHRGASVAESVSLCRALVFETALLCLLGFERAYTRFYGLTSPALVVALTLRPVPFSLEPTAILLRLPDVVDQRLQPLVADALEFDPDPFSDNH